MKRWLFFLVLLIGAGLVLWYVKYLPGSPPLSSASVSSRFSLAEIKRVGSNFDHEIAEIIRTTAENGIKLPEIGSFQAVKQVSQATVSATISTSPEELWKTFREQGSEAVLSGLTKNAQLSVNDVSTEVMNEARYQFCTGVVAEYERQRVSSASAQP